jgi:hypothetical protein
MSNFEIEKLLQSSEYQNMKQKYEKEYFKLRGHYVQIMYDETFLEHTVAEMTEIFRNKKVKFTYSDVVKTEGSNGKTKVQTNEKEIQKSFFTVWREDESILTYDKIDFICDPNLVKPNIFNLFTGFNHFDHLEKKEKDLSIILDHINSLCGFQKEMFEGYIAYLANIVQRPYYKTHSTHIFVGGEGVGKDEHYKFISKVIGEKYCLLADKLESVTGKFNSLLGGKLFVVINETDPKESREREGMIKSLITADKITIEGKYKDPIVTKNYTNIVWFSNKLFAFPVENGNRRPRISETSSKYIDLETKEKAKYFSKLIKLFNNQDYQYAFLRYLQAYDISKFNFQKVIKSKLQEDLEQHSIPIVATFLSDILNDIEVIQAHTAVIKKVSRIEFGTVEFYELFTGYIEANKFNYRPDSKKFKFDIMHSYGIEYLKSNGKHLYIFNKNNLKEKLTKLHNIKFDDDTNLFVKHEKTEAEILKEQLAELQRKYDELLLNKNEIKNKKENKKEETIKENKKETKKVIVNDESDDDYDDESDDEENKQLSNDIKKLDFDFDFDDDNDKKKKNKKNKKTFDVDLD